MLRQTCLILAMTGALVATGCAKPGERVRFDGNYYPAKAKKVGERHNFVVTVRRVDQGIDGAREAGRYEGTDYCVKLFGDSTIAWNPGPDDAASRIVADNGNLVLRGTCNKW
ncbi:hypothetical protein [Roseovarius sp. E0-M6]|uniref:hypothetical protein n=1 Tax=Roseovarius sp. E0-M6 TaxID=3127118 RepID=UPI00300F9685